jgi:hypothetical protein
MAEISGARIGVQSLSPDVGVITDVCGFLLPRLCTNQLRDWSELRRMPVRTTMGRKQQTDRDQID